MRLLLLWTAALFAAAAAALLLAALVGREVRVRRRARVARALEAVVAGGDPGRLPGRVRRAVVLELADRVGAESVPRTAELVRRTAAQATAELSSRRWLRRAKGLRTLMPLGLTVEELLAGFADRSAQVRAQAATAAVERSEPEVLDGLVGLLDDPSPFVRFTALDAVARRTGGAGEALARALDTAPLLGEDELPAAEQALARVDADAAAVVRSLAAAADPAAPARGTRSPGTAGRAPVATGVVAVALPASEAATPGLSDTLPRPLRSTTIVLTATRTLLLLLRGAGASTDHALVRPVQRFTGDARPEVRAAAVDALAALGAETGLLLPGLADADGRVRAAAARALGRSGGRALAGRLAAHLSDRDHGVRQATAAALAGLGAPGVLVLRAALRSPDPYAADAARSALGLPPEPAPETARPADAVPTAAVPPPASRAGAVPAPRVPGPEERAS